MVSSVRPSMGIAYLKDSVVHEEGSQAAEKVSSFWKIMLSDGGVEVNIFPVNESEIVIATDNSADMDQVIDFLEKTQTGVLDHFTFNDKRYFKSEL